MTKKSSRAGFTLIEVMLAVVFLALGTLMIQEGFLRSANLYGRYVNTIRASVWMNGRLWSARETTLFSEEVPPSENGELVLGGVPFRWSLGVQQVDEVLYALRLAVEWNEGSRPLTLTREIYATKPKQLS